MNNSRCFEPCEKMPIIDFLKCEFSDDNIFEPVGEGYILKKNPPDIHSKSFWSCDYGTEERYSNTWYMLEEMLGIDRPCPCRNKETDLPEDIIKVNKKQAKLLRECKITIDPEIADQDTGVRRPYYRLRGKPVTSAQRQLVEDTVDFEWERPSTRHLGNFSNNFFTPFNGIYCNAITQKYPHIGEYIDDALFLAMRFPFLDLIIAITCWDEMAPEAFDNLINDVDDDWFGEGQLAYDIKGSIDIGIYVHGGNVELLNPEHTWEVYSEYDKTSTDDTFPDIDLPVFRKVDPDKLPKYFDRCFLPEDFFKDDDKIEKARLRLHSFVSKVFNLHPYKISNNLTNIKGKKISAIVVEQGKLLKKYLGLNLKFESDYGEYLGFLIYSKVNEPSKYLHIDDPDKWSREPICATVKGNIHAYIRHINCMIKEYLVWCYERRIDPYFYNIIPLTLWNGNRPSFICKTDLHFLIKTERIWKGRHLIPTLCRTAVMISNAYEENKLEMVFSEPESQNGKTRFERMPVVSCRLSTCLNQSEREIFADLAEIHFRMDKDGTLCFSMGSLFGGTKNNYEMIKLYDNKFSFPTLSGFYAFCLLSIASYDNKVLSLLLKKVVDIFGIYRKTYKVIMPVADKNMDNSAKSIGEMCMFRIPMKTNEFDFSELCNYIDSTEEMF